MLVPDLTGSADETESKTEQGEKPETNKTFSQDEVNKMIAERLAREQKKTDARIADMTKQFEAEKQEAAKLAKMNADDKAKYAAEKREQELTAREAEVQKKELRFEALNILEEDKLPSKLIGCVDLSSADACKASIEAIKEAWSEAWTAADNARKSQNTPPPHLGGNNNPKDAFLQGFNEG